MRRVDQVQHRLQRPLRRALTRPHHDLGCEYIDLAPVWRRDSGRGDPIEVSDGDQSQAFLMHYILICVDVPQVPVGRELGADSVGGQVVRHHPCARAHASLPCPVPALLLSCGKADNDGEADQHPVRRRQPLSPDSDGVPLSAVSSVCG